MNPYLTIKPDAASQAVDETAHYWSQPTGIGTNKSRRGTFPNDDTAQKVHAALARLGVGSTRSGTTLTVNNGESLLGGELITDADKLDGVLAQALARSA